MGAPRRPPCAGSAAVVLGGTDLEVRPTWIPVLESLSYDWPAVAAGGACIGYATAARECPRASVRLL